MEQWEFYEKICKSSDLNDIQLYINNVLEMRGFNNQTAQDKILLLTEEIGELAKAVRKSASSMAVDYNKIDNYNTVESEVADVFIVLMQYIGYRRV